jgi:hypothetical protein
MGLIGFPLAVWSIIHLVFIMLVSGAGRSQCHRTLSNLQRHIHRRHPSNPNPIPIPNHDSNNVTTMFNRSRRNDTMKAYKLGNKK